MVVDGFWVGAQRASRGVAVANMARDAGGWEALADCSEADLVQLGCPAGLAAGWVAARPMRTRGRALTYVDPRYPEPLRELANGPPVLIVEGDMAALQAPAVAIVGTRSCTSYGLAVARDLAAACADAGRVVISGLARGIDAAAHRGTLGRGRTVAVLAHGLRHTAPSRHIPLRRELLDSGGAVVTTWWDGVPPRRHAFPMRNRWIAGLAASVVVVEAPVRSGAMHTARAANEYGRDLFAVPGPLGAPASAGCLRLIRDGAAPIVSVHEFVEVSGARLPREPWMDLLLAGACIEEVALVRGAPVLELLAEVSQLEALGFLVRLPGQRYARGPVSGWA